MSSWSVEKLFETACNELNCELIPTVTTNISHHKPVNCEEVTEQQIHTTGLHLFCILVFINCDLIYKLDKLKEYFNILWELCLFSVFSWVTITHWWQDFRNSLELNTSVWLLFKYNMHSSELRGAGRQILLPSDRAWLTISPHALCYAKLIRYWV